MASASVHPLPPGSTIGIMGGGQLGRMTALAAARLGYKCHIFCPDEDSPASQVSAQTTVAAYDDIDALKSFAEQVDVVTCTVAAGVVCSLLRTPVTTTDVVGRPRGRGARVGRVRRRGFPEPRRERRGYMFGALPPR